MTSTPAAELPAPAPTSARHRRPSPPPARCGALRLGVLFLLTTAALAAAVLAHPGQPVFQSADDTWLRWMGGPHNGPYAAVATVLNWLGGPLGVVVPVGLLVFLGVRRRWPSLLFLLTAYVAGNLLVVQALKLWVDRPRPAQPLVRVDHGSFPSGHTAGMALLVVVVGALLVPAPWRRRWWAAGIALTGAMMWSRTWLHAHWLTDTLAGAMTGAGAALVLWWLFTPLLAREADASRRRIAVGEPTCHED
ncbi:phosphatase PAP2 family protein [Streptomyces sp. ISL-22]|uniref:phosphatase PAP2 family protein n=1 Tax=unclassified Streptomyces TaxID=2593676 RepID=UPI001BE599BB|nr:MULTISPECIES: phosphatase PAP2 family protein [unclassified Streptomyces]MBT2422471.1 phosphatase PAP2 family protein [Streptomyces sp. ISL-24]MBT2436522.1 phosphatase PAP2 family protein [Streptomyces sp. ISL-22]